MGETTKIKGRFSYLCLDQPRTIRGVPDSKPAYSGKLIIDPSDKAGRKEKAKVDRLIDEAIEEGIRTKPKWGGKRPKNLQIQFWQDGNERDDMKKTPEYNDMWILSGRAGMDYRPICVDRDPEVTIDPKKIVSGDYGYFAVKIYPYEDPKPGIACALNFVQFLKKGEPLAGKGDPTKIFDNEEEDADDDDDDLY